MMKNYERVRLTNGDVQKAIMIGNDLTLDVQNVATHFLQRNNNFDMDNYSYDNRQNYVILLHCLSD